MNEITTRVVPPCVSQTNRRQVLLPIALLVYALAFVGFAVAALVMPDSGTVILLTSAIAGALIALYLGFLFSDIEVNSLFMVLMIIGGLAVDVIFNFPGALHLSPDFSGQVLAAVLKGIANLGVLTAATGAGLLVAKGLREPRYLIMAAVVAAITDIFSVYAGPTKHIVTTEAFPYVAYQWGLIGTGGVFPCIGVGDFVFLVLFLAGVRKFGLPQKKTLFALAAALVVGFLSTTFSPRGIPALPFMSVGLLIVNRRALKNMQ